MSGWRSSRLRRGSDMFDPGVSRNIIVKEKTTLLQSIITCTGTGSSTISLPIQTSTSTAAGVPTTTTIQTSTVSGCANSTATALSGTTVPTNTELKPAFGFGILLNSNLFKYFFSGKS